MKCYLLLRDGKVKMWHCGDGRCIADLAQVNSSINCCQIAEAPPYLDIGQPRQSNSKFQNIAYFYEMEYMFMLIVLTVSTDSCKS